MLTTSRHQTSGRFTHVLWPVWTLAAFNDIYDVHILARYNVMYLKDLLCCTAGEAALVGRSGARCTFVALFPTFSYSSCLILPWLNNIIELRTADVLFQIPVPLEPNLESIRECVVENVSENVA